MTTIDLLRRYSSHEDSIYDGKTSHGTKAFKSMKPDPSMPDPDPSQYFDAKTKLLHDMLDGVVKDLANNQSEPASEYEGTLWRSPLQPRSRSPAYSEISDSFESPGRIEHCTHNLLSTPMSPTSTQFKGPDGWPLGIEVAMNEFHRGRLSTPILQEMELPNRLILRKQWQQKPQNGGNGNREGQVTACCKSVLFERKCDGQHQQDSMHLKPLEGQINALFQQCGGRRDHLGSKSLDPLASQQQRRPQRQNDCRHQQETVDPYLRELQPESNGENRLDALCIQTLSARKYGDERSSLDSNASTDLNTALANGNLPIGLGLENTNLELSIFQPCSEELDGFYTRTNGTCLLHGDSRQTALSDKLPRNTETDGNVHQAEPQINALAAALDEQTESSRALSALGALGSIGVKSIDREIGYQVTLEDSRNYSQAIGRLTFEDSKASTDSDTVSWNTLGLLEDILEESEDLLTSTLTLDQGQPQHLIQGSAEPFGLKNSNEASEKCDSMIAYRGPLTESSILSSSPLRVPPTQNLTINPPSKLQFESTKPSTHRFLDAKPPESILPVATVAELNCLTSKEGRLSAAALTELRKVAESQPHFQSGPDSPEDQPQAEIHPLLRFKSISRPFPQPSKIINDAALKYVFEDNDNQGHEGDSVGHRTSMKPCSFFQLEAQDAESFVTHTSMKEHTLSPLGKMINDAVPMYLCMENDKECQEAGYVGTFTPQRSTVRSSNDTTSIQSLENATTSSSSRSSTSPSTMNRLSISAADSSDVVPTPVFRSSISPATKGYHANSADESPTTSNSWASTPRHRKYGNSCCTPSSVGTVPTSAVPTPNTPFYKNKPTSHGMKMTPCSSSGQHTGILPSPRGIPMTLSSSFGEYAGNKTYRRSESFSSMFARYRKAWNPDIPTAMMTDPTISSKWSAKSGQAREVINDPFTSTRDSNTQFNLLLRAPNKEDLVDTQAIGADKLNTPTKRSSGRFSQHRRSLSTSGRPKTIEGIERALSTLIFNPGRSRTQERSHGNSASTDTTAKPDGRGRGHRRSFSVPDDTVEQKWEIAPPPTSLDLRDEFSMRYRPEPLEANHYASQKDALQGVKQGLRKVFGRK